MKESEEMVKCKTKDCKYYDKKIINHCRKKQGYTAVLQCAERK